MSSSRIKHRLYMRKYRKTDKSKAYMNLYFKDYYKRDYAAKAKNDRQNAYRKKNGYPIRKSLDLYKYYIKATYNITLDDYKKMLINQDYRCKICLTHHSKFKKQLAIDHCHKTGKIRGLLCHHCNSAIGNLKDNIKSLERAKQYIMRFK